MGSNAPRVVWVAWEEEGPQASGQQARAAAGCCCRRVVGLGGAAARRGAPAHRDALRQVGPHARREADTRAAAAHELVAPQRLRACGVWRVAYRLYACGRPAAPHALRGTHAKTHAKACGCPRPSAPPPPTCSMIVVPSGDTVSSTISVKPTRSITCPTDCCAAPGGAAGLGSCAMCTGRGVAAAARAPSTACALCWGPQAIACVAPHTAQPTARTRYLRQQRVARPAIASYRSDRVAGALSLGYGQRGGQ